jgi:hypothetical protein
MSPQNSSSKPWKKNSCPTLSAIGRCSYQSFSGKSKGIAFARNHSINRNEQGEQCESIDGPVGSVIFALRTIECLRALAQTLISSTDTSALNLHTCQHPNRLCAKSEERCRAASIKSNTSNLFEVHICRIRFVRMLKRIRKQGTSNLGEIIHYEQGL